ncbi:MULTISPECIES: CerR family C-terminal domain-containing protein [Burkholderia]|uniref:CerR family C-terminal domain-containing protein n=1 Tax=Burkholderia TaxID=32008 RepID=UPI00084139F5|nr:MULTISPECIES: CerR family C-terminal domain-containing protein [unclassified Burkholderia]AOK30525.1 TetR family transcriptional regulator [Burkholderia sp. Bp7605]
MKEAKKLRRASAAGYARGEETKQRIIEAAVELFGEHGFAGASTRDIAARAGVNAPALQYYFENKEGVYRACIEAIADQAWNEFGPAVEHARRVLDANAPVPELIEAFVQILEVVAGRMFEKANKQSQRMFFAREQAGYEPDSATEIITRRVRRPLNDVGAALIARITGSTPDDPVTLIRMSSLFGQFVIFHTARRSMLTLLQWNEFDDARVALLKATINAQTRALLEQWSREREAKQAKRKPSRAAAAATGRAGRSTR